MGVKQTEALKLALEALKQIDEAMPFPVAKLAQQVIREALAEQPAPYPEDYEPPCKTGSQCTSKCQQCEQPAQEPVAYSYTSRITGAQGFSHHPMPRFIDSESWDIKPLYTSPPPSKPWVGLTNQELIDLTTIYSGAPLYCAIETKLREKNEHGIKG